MTIHYRIAAGCARLHARGLAFALLLATIFSGVALVPPSGDTLGSAAQAHHWPPSCGREGQRPCPLLGRNRHVPSCMPNLVERPFGQRCSARRPPPSGGVLPTIVPRPEAVSGCGALGERPCTVVQAFPSCEGSLVQHLIQNRCIRSEGDIVNMSRNTIRELRPLLSTIGQAIVGCGIDVILGSQNLSPSSKVERIQSLPCWSSILHQARTNGYRTLTLGSSGGVALGIGAEGENGFAFDTDGTRPVTTYHTLSLTFNDIGASVAIIVGLYKRDNRSFGGDAHGATVGFTALGGGGAGVWFDYGNAEVQGVNAIITSGARFNLAYVRNTTEILPTTFAATPPQRPGTTPRPNPRPGTRPRPDPRPGPRPEPEPPYPDKPKE